MWFALYETHTGKLLFVALLLSVFSFLQCISRNKDLLKEYGEEEYDMLKHKGKTYPSVLSFFIMVLVLCALILPLNV